MTYGETTGSLLTGGLIDGMGKGVNAVGSIVPSDKINQVLGNPSGLLMSVVYSGIAMDNVNNEIYMSKSGTDWIQLGSVSFS